MARDSEREIKVTSVLKLAKAKSELNAIIGRDWHDKNESSINFLTKAWKSECKKGKKIL